MIYHEHFYKLFKTSWGILIGFKGQIGRLNDTEDFSKLIKISDSIFLKLTISEKNKFIHENINKIINGIIWAASQLHIDENILIVIDEIDLNFCNFQIEGLFFGIAEWLCSYYNLKIPPYMSTYNRDLNKYEFSFEKSDPL